MKRFLAICFLFLPFVEGSDDCRALAKRILSSISSSSREPLHIVTLTRQQNGIMQGSCYTMRSTYSPITASEACTLFAVANLFLGEEDDKCFLYALDTASRFDEAEFLKVVDFNKSRCDKKKEKIENLLEKDIAAMELPLQTVKEILLRAVLNGGIEVESAYVKIQNFGEELKLKNDFLNSDERSTKARNILTGKGSVLKANLEDQSLTIKANKTYSVDLFYKLNLSKGMNVAISDNQLKELDTLLNKIDAETESDDQLLNVYRQLTRKPKSDYVSLYFNFKEKLSGTCIKNCPCIFVSNELFFGKDYVLLLEYPNFIPPAPKNVLSCVNFLQETIVTYLPKQIPADGDRYSSYELSRETFRQKNETGDCSFRNVSFYRVGKELVQVYTKSSYCDESPSALSWMPPTSKPKSKLTYRFGIDRDVAIDDIFFNIVSTQICYDLGSARINQKDIIAPIHIIQSNTKDIRGALNTEEQPAIPGHPRVIIHADPDWQEVYVTSKKIKWSSEETVSEKLMEYPVKESIDFEVPKQCGLTDVYTLTHWVLHSDSFASLPANMSSASSSSSSSSLSPSSPTKSSSSST